MGAWGYGTFENDDSLDWIGTLDNVEEVTPLAQALSVAVETTGYLETHHCCEALAAAEIVAAIRGRPANDLPQDGLDYAGRLGDNVPQDLVSEARAAVERVRSKSELRDLFEESDGLANWLAVVDALRKRLGDDAQA
jgi:hypothetical protein